MLYNLNLPLLLRGRRRNRSLPGVNIFERELYAVIHIKRALDWRISPR